MSSNRKTAIIVGVLIIISAATYMIRRSYPGWVDTSTGV